MWPGLTLRQPRRQDIATGGSKTRKRGQKPEGGPHFEKTVLDVCSNHGAKRQMGGHRFQIGRPGTTGPPSGYGSALRVFSNHIVCFNRPVCLGYDEKSRDICVL